MPKLAEDSHFWDSILIFFDFTLKFEEIILQLVPSSVAVLISPAFLTHYQNEPVYVRSNVLLWAKVVRCTRRPNIQVAILSDHRFNFSECLGCSNGTSGCKSCPAHAFA